MRTSLNRISREPSPKILIEYYSSIINIIYAGDITKSIIVILRAQYTNFSFRRVSFIVCYAFFTRYCYANREAISSFCVIIRHI
jgi:hypothetical protein